MRHLILKDPWQEFKFGRRPKSVLVIRYGAFGDMLQASSVFPGLKEQGYFVTVNTTERGYDIIRNDPHVDEIIVQKTNQVPNGDLDEYWAYMGRNFDKVVNLSESVEGSLLAIEGRRNFKWSQGFRDLLLNVDYLEGVHAIADVPLPPKPMFYPSAREKKEALIYRRKLGLKNFVVLWALSGSSVHKVWPYIDNVVAGLMLSYPEIKVIFVGDQLSQLLELRWEKEKRVIRKSGKWSIRQTLSFAHQADLIIGPETGVLNAVSFMDMPKVLMLSHSSKKNLGGSWENTTVLEPENTPCYPCHKLHYGWDTCNRTTKTGGALCAENITPDRVIEAINIYKVAA